MSDAETQLDREARRELRQQRAWMDVLRSKSADPEMAKSLREYRKAIGGVRAQVLLSFQSLNALPSDDLTPDQMREKARALRRNRQLAAGSGMRPCKLVSILRRVEARCEERENL